MRLIIYNRMRKIISLPFFISCYISSSFPATAMGIVYFQLEFDYNTLNPTLWCSVGGLPTGTNGIW